MIRCALSIYNIDLGSYSYVITFLLCQIYVCVLFLHVLPFEGKTWFVTLIILISLYEWIKYSSCVYPTINIELANYERGLRLTLLYYVGFLFAVWICQCVDTSYLTKLFFSK